MQVPPWQLWDTRVLTQQAQRQGMRLRWDDKHYLPIAYEVGQTCKLQSRKRTEAQLRVAPPTLGTAPPRD